MKDKKKSYKKLNILRKELNKFNKELYKLQELNNIQKEISDLKKQMVNLALENEPTKDNHNCLLCKSHHFIICENTDLNSICNICCINKKIMPK